MNALVGVTAVAAATPLTAAPQEPDTELVELGHQLAAEWPKAARLRRDSFELTHRSWILLREKVGIPFNVCHGHPNLAHLSRADASHIMEAWGACGDNDDTEAGVFAELEAQDVSTDAIMERIAALPATTVGGLVAKAVAAAWWNNELWDDEPRDLNCDQEKVRDLIESVLAVGGISNLFASHSARFYAEDIVPPPPKGPDAVMVAIKKHDQALAARKRIERQYFAAQEAAIGTPEGSPERARLAKLAKRNRSVVNRECEALKEVLKAKPANRLIGAVLCSFLIKQFEREPDLIDAYDLSGDMPTLMLNLSVAMVPEDELKVLLDHRGQPDQE